MRGEPAQILWSPTGIASVAPAPTCGDDERMSARVLLALLCSLLLVAPAEAAVSAKVTVSGGRLIVTVKGVKAKAVTAVAGGKTYKLTRSGSKWRSAKIAGISALAGSAVKVKVRS